MKATAPASSANLGPGFDSLALALELRCQVSVEPSISWDFGEDPDGFIEAGARRLSDDPIKVKVASDIPVGKGLGSSAALLTALAAAIGGLEDGNLDRAEVFSRVAALEGHPDNAAAATFGGLVLAHPGGVHLLEMHPSLAVVVGVPPQPLPTTEARAALPDSVPFAVAARTANRAMRLIEGLRTGDVDLLAGVGADELHEPARAALRDDINRLLSAARDGGATFAALSGAGPSVVAIVEQGEVESVKSRLTGPDWVVISPAVALDGVRLLG